MLNLHLLAGVAIIVLAAFLAYFPALNGGFILDDDKLLTDNSIIKAPDGLYLFWCTSEALDYWPVSNSSLWLEWRVWRMNPTGYHVINLILHIVEALLIWLILRKLSIPGALLAALIFTVHPVNVESVAWIASRKNLLAMLFLLLSILCYLKMETSDIDERQKQNRILAIGCWYVLSFLAFVLAMLSKGSAAVLPILLLGIVWWLRPLKIWDLVLLVPFFVVGAGLAEVNVWFQKHGIEQVYRDANFIERLLGAGGVVWFYLYKALLPVNLCFVYPMWRISVSNLLWWLPLLAAVGITAILISANLWSGAKWSRTLLFAWGYFCAALIPVLGFTDVGFMRFTLVADRYQHIAIIGVIALAAEGWDVWRRQLSIPTRWRAEIIAVAAVGILTLLTLMQCEFYRDSITSYKTALDKNPDWWMGHSNIGAILNDANRPQEAIEHCLQALRIKPDYADAENNLGNAFFKSNRIQEASEHYQKALQLEPNHPQAHNNLGALLFLNGHPQESLKHFHQALQINPDYADAYYNQGNTLRGMGRLQQAIDSYQKALQLNPDYLDAYNNLGMAFFDSKRMEESLACYRRALQINPHYHKSHFNLANTLKALRRFPEAIEHYQKTLLLDPNYIEAHNNLGVALLQSNRPQEAIKHIQHVLSLKSDMPEAYYNLALCYAVLKQPAETIAASQKAAELARAKNQTDLAKLIDNWLNAYRESLSK